MDTFDGDLPWGQAAAGLERRSTEPVGDPAQDVEVQVAEANDPTQDVVGVCALESHGAGKALA